jgi:hypothetical protein
MNRDGCGFQYFSEINGLSHCSKQNDRGGCEKQGPEYSGLENGQIKFLRRCYSGENHQASSVFNGPEIKSMNNHEPRLHKNLWPDPYSKKPDYEY